jgi:hypothetical protein
MPRPVIAARLESGWSVLSARILHPRGHGTNALGQTKFLTSVTTATTPTDEHRSRADRAGRRDRAVPAASRERRAEMPDAPSA